MAYEPSTPMEAPTRHDGIVNLDKPGGMSSARAVDAVKRLLPRGTKIGHAGTLDPFATGVLLLLIGKATRSCERLMDEPKQYQATIKLGATTATDDPESPEQPTPQAAEVRVADVRQVLSRFVGEILQRPPAFSALKVKGRRAYELAREGAVIEMAPRPVRVYSIELLDYKWPFLQVRVDCGRGTYIRALARDIGATLHAGGYLTSLRRTRIGSFEVSSAATLESLRGTGIVPHLAPPL